MGNELLFVSNLGALLVLRVRLHVRLLRLVAQRLFTLMLFQGRLTLRGGGFRWPSLPVQTQLAKVAKFCKSNIENLAKFCNFLAGSFSAVSKPIFANKYAFGSICRHFSSSLALQDLHTLSPKSLFAQVLSSYSSVSASFCCRVIRVHSFLLCGSVPHFSPTCFPMWDCNFRIAPNSTF